MINVRDHGAKGDGVTDDTVPVRQAMAAAGPTGVVYFPAGTYLCGNLNGACGVDSHPLALIQARRGVDGEVMPNAHASGRRVRTHNSGGEFQDIYDQVSA